jgi:hypothetical protein
MSLQPVNHSLPSLPSYSQPQKTSLICKIKLLCSSIFLFIKKIFTYPFSLIPISHPFKPKIEKTVDLSQKLQSKLETFFPHLDFEQEKALFEKDFHRSANTTYRWNGVKTEQCHFLEELIALGGDDRDLTTFLHFSLSQGFPNEIFKLVTLEQFPMNFFQQDENHSRLYNIETGENLVSVKAILTPFALVKDDEIIYLATMAAKITFDKKTKKIQVQAFSFFSSPNSRLSATDPIFSKKFSSL